jgi:hypothetical protein
MYVAPTPSVLLILFHHLIQACFLATDLEYIRLAACKVVEDMVLSESLDE